MRGKDIKKYSYIFDQKYLLYIPWHFPLHNDSTIVGNSQIAEKAFEEQYPAIYAHLLTYKKELANRNKAETGIRYEWYALQRFGSNYMEVFNEKLIAWQRITHEPTFCITEKGMMILDSMAFLVAGIYTKYLIAFLNSKLVYFYVNQITSQYGSTGFRLSNQYVEQIPVIIPTSEEKQKIFIDLVDEILDKKNKGESTQNTENQIEIMVCDLYNLTKEERQIIGL